MGLYDIINEITERQVTKTETGDNRIWGVMVGIVAKNYDPNSSVAGGTNSGESAMDGRVCVTIPTRDDQANELKWARVAPCPREGASGATTSCRRWGTRCCWPLRAATLKSPM